MKRWTQLVPFAVLFALTLAGCGIDYTVTDTPEERDLTTDEIRTQLQGGSFRDKLEARKQIGKLPREQRIKVLEELTNDPDVSTRTIAIQELGKMLPDTGAAEVLARVAAEDPAPDLKALAQEKLTPPAE